MLFFAPYSERLDVNAANATGNTPLHGALTREQPALVRLLLAQGADVNALNKSGASPLYRALVVDSIAYHATPAAERNLGVLLESADIDVSRGLPLATPLHRQMLDLGILASHNTGFGASGYPRETLDNYVSFMTELMEKGLDTGRPGNYLGDDKTLMHAVMAVNEPPLSALADLLLNAGAPLDSLDSNGQTPLHCYLANPMASAALLQRLIAAGADCNQPDHGGATALDVYLGKCARIDEDILAALLSNTADIRRANTHGRTVVTVLQHLFENRVLFDGVLYRGPDNESSKALAQSVTRAVRKILEAGASPVPRAIMDLNALLGREGHNLSLFMPVYHMLVEGLEVPVPAKALGDDNKARARYVRELIKKQQGKYGDYTAVGDAQQVMWRAMVEGDSDTQLKLLRDLQSSPEKRVVLDVLLQHYGLFHEAVERQQHHCVQALLRQGAKPESDDIISAAATNDLTGLRLLLTAAPECINALDGAGNSALHKAAHAGNLECVDWLLNHGADPNQGNHRDVTPLHLASKAGVAEALLRHGAHVNALTAQGNTPLHLVTEGHNLDFIPSERALLDTQDPDGLARLCRVLLDHGADPAICNREGLPVLHHIIAVTKIGQRTHYPVMLLPASGIAPDIVDNRGRTAVNFMLTRKKGPARHWHNHVARVIDLLMAHGGDINAGAAHQERLYAWDIYAGSLRIPSSDRRSILQKLLDYGMDVNSPNPETGDTLLLTACRHNAAAEDIRALLDSGAGASVNVRNHKGETPALALCRAPKPTKSILQMLLDHGADINIADNDGATPFSVMAAREDRKQSIYDMLLDAGAAPATPLQPGDAAIGVARSAAG